MVQEFCAGRAKVPSIVVAGALSLAPSDVANQDGVLAELSGPPAAQALLEPRPSQQDPKSADRSLPPSAGIEVYLARKAIERYQQQDPNMAAFNRLYQRVADKPDLLSANDWRRRANDVSSKSISPAQAELADRQAQAAREPQDLIRTLTRSRVAEMTLRKGSWLTPTEASVIAHRAEADVSEAFGLGGSGLVTDSLRITARAIGTLPAKNLATYGVKTVGGHVVDDALAEREAQSSELRDILRAEASKAVDPNQQALTHRILQQMAEENPLTYDALRTRARDESLLPSRSELERQMKEFERDQSPSLLKKAANSFDKLTAAEKEEIKKASSEIQKRAQETESAIDDSARSEISLRRAEEALKSRFDEISQAGRDPATIVDTEEYRAYDYARRKQEAHDEEVNKCVDQSIDLLSRIDPQMGNIVARSHNLMKGMQGAFGQGLKNIKFSDMLSVTSLAFALFDAFLTGPDPTQMALENLTKMVEGLDKKLDQVLGDIRCLDARVQEGFNKTNANIESARFEAQIFHSRQMELLTKGFQEMIDLQVHTLEAINSQISLAKDISHRVDIQLGVLLRVRDELRYVTELVKKSPIANAIGNLEAALRDGQSSSGDAQTLIQDFRTVVKDVLTVAEMLADTPMLQPARASDAISHVEELELIDLLQVSLIDHPVVIGKVVRYPHSDTLRELKSYQFLDRVLTLLIEVSETDKLNHLSEADRAALRLSPETVAVWLARLEKSQEAVHELGLQAEEYAIQRMQAALQVYESSVDRAINSTVKLDRTTSQELYDPQKPAESLQAIADAEASLGLGAEFRDLLPSSRVLSIAPIEFQCGIHAPRWKQAELRNASGEIMALKFENRYSDDFSKRIRIQKLENAQATPVIYANWTTKEISHTPKEGFLAFYPHGSWDETSRSWAHRAFDLRWSAAPQVVVEVRADKVSFGAGPLIVQPTLRKHQLIGSGVHLVIDSPQLDVREAVSLGASFDEQHGVRTDRAFTDSAPGLPGEKIHLLVEQKQRIFVTPRFTGKLCVGEHAIAHLDLSFAERNEHTFLDVRSTQTFTYQLGFNGVPRGRSFRASVEGLKKFPDGYPMDNRNQVFREWIHIEPQPLNELSPVAQSTSSGEVVSASWYGQRNSDSREIAVTHFQAAQAKWLEALGSGIQGALAARPAQWRDGVLSVFGTEREIASNLSEAGIFKAGNSRSARVRLLHAQDGELSVDCLLPQNYEPSGLQCQVQITFNHDFRAARAFQETNNPTLRFLQQQEDRWAANHAQQRANEVLKQMATAGSSLQQQVVKTEAAALFLRKFYQDYGYQIFSADYELSLRDGGGVRSTLTSRWDDPNDSLLAIAGYLRALGSGKAKDEQPLQLIVGAKEQLREFEDRIKAARRTGARYASPELDRQVNLFRHRWQTQRKR